jgi:signal transduction histidine kinase
MLSNNIEPGLLRIFRYFTGIAMVYFALMVIYIAIQTGQAVTPSQIQSYVNFGINLLLFGYLSLKWLQRKLKRWYLPIALIASTVVLVFSNLVYIAQPSEDMSVIIYRSWVLLPIMVVPLVLLTWQFRFRYLVIFIIFSTIVELSVLLPAVGEINFETVPILGVPLIRAFALGTVGHIVTRLVEIQRNQRKELMRANVQLSQHANTLEQLATSRERNRLARELHDTLAHTLSGLAVNLEAIKIVLTTDPIAAQKMLDHALANTRTGLTETRRALKDLRAQQLEDLGLRIAIHNLALNAASRANFYLDFKTTEKLPDLTPDQEQCFFRIAQEALENTIKYANAQLVIVFLMAYQNGLSMTIADDGNGFNPDEVNSQEKMGIKGMYERATMMGATLEVDSWPGGGTTIHLDLEIPYD